MPVYVCAAIAPRLCACSASILPTELHPQAPVISPREHLIQLIMQPRLAWVPVLCCPVSLCHCDLHSFFVKRTSVSCSSGSPQQCFLVGHNHSSLAYAVIRWVCPWVLGFGNLCSLLLGDGFKGFLRPSIELYRSPFATALSRIMIEGLRSSCAFLAVLKTVSVLRDLVAKQSKCGLATTSLLGTSSLGSF